MPQIGHFCWKTGLPSRNSRGAAAGRGPRPRVVPPTPQGSSLVVGGASERGGLGLRRCSGPQNCAVLFKNAVSPSPPAPTHTQSPCLGVSTNCSDADLRLPFAVHWLRGLPRYPTLLQGCPESLLPLVPVSSGVR